MINKESIILGDCLEIMKTYPDNYFDWVITDPPYGIGEDGGKGPGRLHPHDKWKNPKPSMHKKYDWDRQRPSKEYFDEIIRVSKNQIIFGGNYFSDLLPQSNGWIFWDKKASGDFSRGELIWTSVNKKLVIYEHLWNGFRQMAGLVEKRVHPTQKPLRLLKWIIEDYTKPNEIILDPFAGSGTTLLAAKQTGRSCIAIEINSEYLEISEKRLSQETLELFNKE